MASTKLYRKRIKHYHDPARCQRTDFFDMRNDRPFRNSFNDLALPMRRKSFLLWIIYILGIVQLAIGEDSTDSAIKKEFGNLQGTWRIVSAEYQGKDVTSDAKGQGSEITIQGDAWIQDVKGYALYTKADSSIDISPSTSPKKFDHNVIRKGGTKFVYPGIYELTGDTLKLCWDVTCSNRPTTFSTNAGTSDYSVVLKKVELKDKK